MALYKPQLILVLWYRQEGSQVVLENMIGATNKLCQYWAPNYRHLVCKLGEAVCTNLLHVWHKHPSDAVKVAATRFCIFSNPVI